MHARLDEIARQNRCFYRLCKCPLNVALFDLAKLEPEKSNSGGRLSTDDLHNKVACFVKECK
jgi:hypothetical protein